MSSSIPKWLVFSLLTGLVPVASLAHEEATFTTVPQLQVVAVTEAPSIDGRLDDAVWQQAVPFVGFTQREPATLQPSSEKTELRAVYTDKSLYLVVIASHSADAPVIANEMERDAFLFRDDAIGIFLDTFHDHRNAYFFETNPNGARTDALLTDEGRDFDTNWDGIWRVGVSRNAEGWIAEFEVPFSTVRFDPDKTVWGMNIRRIIRSKNEETYWSPLDLDADVFRISRGGHLTGLNQLNTGLHLQVKPYAVVTDAKSEISSDSLDDGFDGGIDVKWGITDQTTLDLTANTDFAEAEVDDQQVNLTRFSLFFPEKREFFLDNAGIFEFGPTFSSVPLFKVFFSRSVGLAGGRKVDIDWGARFTGRLGGWNIGFLDAQTDSLGDPALSGVPENNWGVLRLKRNLGGRSSAGMIVTQRDGEDGSTHRAYGVDLDWKPTAKTAFWAFGLKSDASELDEDDTLSGGLGFNYNDQVWSAEVSAIDLDSELSLDSGFLLRQGNRRYRAFAAAAPRPADHPKIRNYYFAVDAEAYLREGTSDIESSVLRLDLYQARLHTNDAAGFFVRRQEEDLLFAFDIFPGVSIDRGNYGWWDAGIDLSTSTHRRVFASGTLSAGDFYDGTIKAASIAVNYRPSRFFRTQTNWVHNDIDLPGGAFDFSIIRQRIELSLTPDLSVNGIFQYNDAFDVFGANLRFRWTYRPGSDLYVVYNENWDSRSFSDLATRDRQLIVKLSYLFQL